LWPFVIFSRFGMLCEEKSGNPGRVHTMSDRNALGYALGVFFTNASSGRPVARAEKKNFFLK
jgi:hypothetical protein